MAGPVASVLLRESLDSDGVASLVEWMAKSCLRADDDPELWYLAAPDVLGADHRVAEAGAIGCALAEPDTRDGKEQAELIEVIGYRPAQEISLFAMCNGDQDHAALGYLCLGLAHRYDAFVDFGGALTLGANLRDIPALDPTREERETAISRMAQRERKVPGIIRGIRYRISPGKHWISHVGDATFLDAWLQHPRFRMVK